MTIQPSTLAVSAIMLSLLTLLIVYLILVVIQSTQRKIDLLDGRLLDLLATQHELSYTTKTTQTTLQRNHTEIPSIMRKENAKMLESLATHLSKSLPKVPSKPETTQRLSVPTTPLTPEAVQEMFKASGIDYTDPN